MVRLSGFARPPSQNKPKQVRANFRRYGLLDVDGADPTVVFLPGFFNVSLPPVFGPGSTAKPPPALAVVRIDADAYDGVRDALESLYPRLR